ncbi:MAG: bifunctional diaminohydroxyphosphoribosylaminopyrimidine deaminase/5-amino-6-(5-phosphoribosylamino)uracil reductase RibD [Bacteroidales bacterium]|jgi:diaminohydroxyphosphoribosylaminopyrimidine deaminase/5-amino-6-(5-phosphoribosylamino)uracil reductase|nr:bifunctional diaminohydroxyphosphoribosylaminopyrimidine deaminase/5-amino-6-(5-phosphoribosylamino)uracil reductase RibD [Bacteroidales bacterium]
MKHEKYMQRCIELAEQAFGNTYPNPLVGSVIIYNNHIIGEGFHARAGEAHAEVNAIQSVADKELLKDSTLYVNLEPCSHFGKTPPCCDLIIARSIPRVVVGCVDSYSEVAGRGIEKLRAHGVEVTVGVLEQECRAVNKRFFTYHEKQRPYIILKWAQTADGYIDKAANQKPSTKGVAITDEDCRKEVHTWRTQEQAILVGTNTALFDNPDLTARLAEGHNPLRAVIDLHNRLPETLHVKNGKVPTVIYTLNPQESRTNVAYVRITDKEALWNEIFADLYRRRIQSIIIEGGAKILNNCIAQNLWDEMRILTVPVTFGAGVKAPAITLQPIRRTRIGNAECALYMNAQ